MNFIVDFQVILIAQQFSCMQLSLTLVYIWYIMVIYNWINDYVIIA